MSEHRNVMLTDVLQGKTRGRSSDEQITYSERGNIQGVQFFAVAAVVYKEGAAPGDRTRITNRVFLQDIRD